MRRTLAAWVAAGVAALLIAAPAASAQAADDDWWYTRGAVGAAHDAGFTGKGVRIAVIDTVIDADVPVFEGADLHVHDSLCGDGISSESTDPDLAWHGTNVTAFVLGNGKWMSGLPGTTGAAPEARVDFYGTADVQNADGSTKCSNGAATGTVLGAAIDAAVADGADIISVSLIQGNLTAPVQQAIARAVGKGVILLGGTADTQKQAVFRSFPAAANGVVAVGQIGSDLELGQDAGAVVNDGTNVVVAPGVGLRVLGDTSTWDTTVTASGTSWATPIVAGWLAVVKQKYPKATNDQLLQSLITNTGTTDHPVSRGEDGFGYGIASLTHMLKVDPTKYDDENPLIRDGSLDKPTRAQIEAAAATSSPSPSPSGDSQAESPTSSSGLPGWLIPVVVGAIVIVIAIVVLVIVLARRGKNSTAA